MAVDGRKSGIRWKEQRGRNGGIVGIPWKMRIVEFVRQQAVLCLLVFLYNAENPWNPQRDWNTFFLKVRKIRLFSYKVFHFTFIPNRRTVAIVHNFIDYFRWIESLFVIGACLGSWKKRNSNFRWNSREVDVGWGHTRDTMRVVVEMKREFSRV